MTTTLETAGYIIHDGQTGLIHGYGDTREAAWADMLDTMKAANIALVPDDAEEDTVDASGYSLRASDMKVVPATEKLLALVEDAGGNCAWGTVDGVACTADEEEEA